MPSFGLAVAVMYYKPTQNLELMNFEALQHNVKIRQKGKHEYFSCVVACSHHTFVQVVLIHPI